MGLSGDLSNYGDLLDTYNMQTAQAVQAAAQSQPPVVLSHGQLTAALLHLDSMLQASGAAANRDLARQITEMSDSSLQLPLPSRQTTEMSLMSLMPALSQQTTESSLLSMPGRQITEKSLGGGVSRQTTEMSLNPGNSRQTTEGCLSPDGHGHEDLYSSPEKKRGKQATKGDKLATSLAKQNQGKDKQGSQGIGGKEANKKNKFANTRVSSDDFAKFDIDVEKIANGEDQRTTVMVRKLIGPHARDNFLKFLLACNLDKRYTFFYMPCKERRTTPAGFAFVNFMHAIDIFKLHMALHTGLWEDPSTKPSLSYARFQGHAQLEEHFSASAVLHESDEHKRPIFRAPEPMNHGCSGKEMQLRLPDATNMGHFQRLPMKVPQNRSNLLPVSPLEPAFLPLPSEIMAGSTFMGPRI